MAEALGVASGLIALAQFAFHTSKTLFQLIESFKSNKRTIRELRDEVESLNEALGSLQNVTEEYEAELSTLKLPLLRCGKTCKEFADLISKCTGHSGGQGTSFRDWAKLQYMGGDVTQLRTALAGYKATISIAIGGATFRHATVTVSVLHQYKQMIADATSDLHDHLQEIDDRVRSMHQQSGYTQPPQIDVCEIKEEKESTEQCLAICAQVSEFIEGLQVYTSPRSLAENSSTYRSAKKAGINFHQSEQTTDAMLEDFKARLSTQSASLKLRLVELNHCLKELTEQRGRFSSEDSQKWDLIKEEKESIIQCISICADASDLAGKARTNSFEDVSSSDDSRQLIVSTIGDLISAKHIKTGNRSEQWLGQMSDDTVKQLI
ncbi:hypothetical protein ETB97_005291 [Aspergillus alliaceus]|uniref:Azaphilone pigments biosynthesis cluster protein L N-terminal domain-containing protein n=1 Tax=Petromyces alliaceus TaxID=209559 RepID=A0A8H6E476_PETAA|nr:hypothetical protein ETB97_005291 [Aspergillus burnettii]